MRSGVDRGDRKTPEQSQLLVVLIIAVLVLRADQGGIEPENKANFRTAAWGSGDQPFQHVAPCIIMSQGNGLRPSKLPRQGCIPRHVLVPLPALGPMPVPTLV